jgi:hypothetical protein
MFGRRGRLPTGPDAPPTSHGWAETVGHLNRGEANKNIALTPADSRSQRSPGEDDAGPAVGTDGPAVLNGSFQVVWTGQELMAATGSTSAPRAGNAATYTLTFADGEIDLVWCGPEDRCRGSYAVSGTG